MYRLHYGRSILANAPPPLPSTSESGRKQIDAGVIPQFEGVDSQRYEINQESRQLKGRTPATQRGRRDDAEMEKKIRGLWTGHQFFGTVEGTCLS